MGDSNVTDSQSSTVAGEARPAGPDRQTVSRCRVNSRFQTPEFHVRWFRRAIRFPMWNTGQRPQRVKSKPVPSACFFHWPPRASLFSCRQAC